ncbi:HNH endonuclease signature motif containing protein [Kineosporia babensis]|uniref:HNH endonuclease n=1 Tax=Kineosporia babensis TaxID=499548 RepID=A0A9X1SRQ0_9ACTN|nr:HNH endonuclease [Kineosporia babensis]
MVRHMMVSSVGEPPILLGDGVIRVGDLAEGRLHRRTPQELAALAEWLLDELDPAVFSSESPAADADVLVELAIQQEWMIRSIQAQRVRTLAQAVKVMPPARRFARKSSGSGQGRHPDRTADTDQAADSNQPAGPEQDVDSATRISPLRLISARVAPEVNCHPRSTTTLLEHARGLVEDLPTIMNLFGQARLDQARAVLITKMLHQATEKIDDFEPGSNRWVMTETMIASQAPGLTALELERLINRLLLELQPDAGVPAHEEARRSRHVQFEALDDGMALISAMVPADIAQLLHGFLDAVADAERDSARAAGNVDPRTHDQRCADALASLVQAVTNGMRIPLATDSETGESATSERPPAADQPNPTVPPAEVVQAWRQILSMNGGRSRKTLLNVTITDATLLGLDNTPGLLEGHGPVAASLARRLGIKPAQVNLIVLPDACTHPPAHNSDQAEKARRRSPSEAPCPAGLDHTLPGVNRYRPGRALTAMLTALYPTCVFPGCSTPAARCDLDHLKPFDQGGVTCPCNMRPCCRSHHRLKTFGSWSARASGPDEPYPFGSTVWTAPNGSQHHTPSPCLPGMPGWALSSVPSDPAPSPLSRVDLMPAEERTVRRTRKWQSGLDWWTSYKTKMRQQAEQRARENPPPLPRPRHAPWGEGRGRVPGLGEPPF